MQVSVSHFETQAQPILAPVMSPWPRSSDRRRAEWLAVSDDKDKPLSVALHTSHGEKKVDRRSRGEEVVLHDVRDDSEMRNPFEMNWDRPGEAGRPKHSATVRSGWAWLDKVGCSTVIQHSHMQRTL